MSKHPLRAEAERLDVPAALRRDGAILDDLRNLASFVRHAEMTAAERKETAAKIDGIARRLKGAE